MKILPVCAFLAVLVAVTACTTHEKETVIERQPKDQTVIVVPPANN